MPVEPSPYVASEQILPHCYLENFKATVQCLQVDDEEASFKKDSDLASHITPEEDLIVTKQELVRAHLLFHAYLCYWWCIIQQCLLPSETYFAGQATLKIKYEQQGSQVKALMHSEVSDGIH